MAPWGRTWSADASARTTASNSPAAKWLFKSRRPSTSTSPCAALGPPEHRPPRRRIALGYRGAPAEPANERVLSGRPDAGDLHCRTVAPLPPLAPQDPGILGRLAEPGARRGDHRTLHPRIRPGERARRRATHSGGARGRYRPSRRDPLVSARRPALDVGGDDGDDDHLPHRQPPQGGTDRADRRRLPGLAGHRRLRRLPRSSAPPALPGA